LETQRLKNFGQKGKIKFSLQSFHMVQIHRSKVSLVHQSSVDYYMCEFVFCFYSI
jgi:hypothetical protein